MARMRKGSCLLGTDAHVVGITSAASRVDTVDFCSSVDAVMAGSKGGHVNKPPSLSAKGRHRHVFPVLVLTGSR